MRILPANNLTTNNQSNSKQNINFKAHTIPKSDLLKVLGCVGEDRLENLGGLLGNNQYIDRWATRKEVKKWRKLIETQGMDAADRYLTGRAKRAKSLTYNDCQTAFEPLKKAKDSTDEAQAIAEKALQAVNEAKKKEKAAYIEGLMTLGII